MDWKAFFERVLLVCESAAWKIVAAGLLLLVGHLVIKTVVKRMEKSRFVKKADRTVHRFMISLVKVSAYIFLIISVVAILGVPLASLITVLGSAGVAISLAVQGTLGNLASGVMLLLFKPFRVGEYIESGGHEGFVNEIGIFYTTLVSHDKRMVVIPNSNLTSSTLTNYSREKVRRLDVPLALAYGTDQERVRKAVMEVLARHEDILDDPAPAIRLTAMQDSWICMTLRVWCDWYHYWDLNFDLQEEIYKHFGEVGLDFQFPVVEVHMKKEEE